MSRPIWFVEFLKKIYPSRFFLAKTTKIPLVGHIVDQLFFKGDSLFFLPQDSVAQRVLIEEDIEPPSEVVLPSQVVEYFIRQASVHWVMNFCICRASEECQNYPIELGCLFLGEAALGINPKLGRRVSETEALEHVRRCRDAGLVHFVGRNKLDTVWLGVGPGEKLLTICNCCPCCCLWGMLPNLAPEIGDKIKRMPGVTVEVNDQCTGCGICAQDVCFVQAIRLEDDQAVISAECRGCGRCVDVCPEGAIELSIEWERAGRDVVDHLSTLVDVE